MQCQLCNNHATVHLTEIVNGQKIERHLCEQCAMKEGITIKAHVPINEMIDNLMLAQKEAKHIEDLTCPECHMTWRDFRKGGLLGCPRDYEVFAEPLERLIERAQEGATQHVGLVPKGSEPTQQIKLLHLRRELQQALEEEDYEAAANLRDEIHKYEPN